MDEVLFLGTVALALGGMAYVAWQQRATVVERLLGLALFAAPEVPAPEQPEQPERSQGAAEQVRNTVPDAVPWRGNAPEQALPEVPAKPEQNDITAIRLPEDDAELLVVLALHKRADGTAFSPSAIATLLGGRRQDRIDEVRAARAPEDQQPASPSPGNRLERPVGGWQ